MGFPVLSTSACCTLFEVAVMAIEYNPDGVVPAPEVGLPTPWMMPEEVQLVTPLAMKASSAASHSALRRLRQPSGSNSTLTSGSMRQPVAPRVLTELCAWPVVMMTVTLLEAVAPTVMLAEGLNVQVALVGIG